MTTIDVIKTGYMNYGIITSLKDYITKTNHRNNTEITQKYTVFDSILQKSARMTHINLSIWQFFYNLYA